MLEPLIRSGAVCANCARSTTGPWRRSPGETGISVGTLSKLEHGKTDLNFTSVNKLATGLGLPVTDLTNPGSRMQGRRAITMGGQGAMFNTPDVDYEVLCSEVANHQQGYLKGVVKSHTFDPELPWHRHQGQEFLYVLSGRLELHTELYEPVQLKAGDSILFDSSMGHHYVSLGRKTCRSSHQHVPGRLPERV